MKGLGRATYLRHAVILLPVRSCAGYLTTGVLIANLVDIPDHVSGPEAP